MATAIGRDLMVQLLQGFHEVKLEVQGLQGRIGRLEGRMDRLEGRMGTLEGQMGTLATSNGEILGYVKRIVRMLPVLTSFAEEHDGMRERLDDLERRIAILGR